jgi:hypothetical protein
MRVDLLLEHRDDLIVGLVARVDAGSPDVAVVLTRDR